MAQPFRVAFLSILVALAAIAGTALAAPDVLAHSGSRIAVPPENLSTLGTVWEFSKYGVKHILLGYDHLLFLIGLSVLSANLRDVVAIVALFAFSYSTTLIGGTLLGVEVPGDLIDAIIAISVGYVGVQIAFGREGGWPSRNPRGPALVFGLAHGLGLSSLLQELQLPGNDVLPSVLGFNVGVEMGQIAVILALVAVLSAAGAFPFPPRERIPAGCALVSAATVLLVFVLTGVSL